MSAPKPLSASERLVEDIAMPIARWDRQARLLHCNASYASFAAREAETMLGQTVQQIFGPLAWQIAREAFEQAFGGQTVFYQRRLTHDGGHSRWVRVQVIPERDPAGEVAAVFTMVLDVHAEEMERLALSASRRRLDRFTDNIPYPLTYVDKQCVLQFVNRAYVEMSGQAAGELVGRHIGEARGDALWQRHRTYFERALAGETVHDSRLVEGMAQGSRWMRTSYVPDLGDDGQVAGVYTVTIDVHDLTVAQEKLRRSAERDPLTDTLSRRCMMERIDAAVAGAVHAPVALFFVDLDGFKSINDSLGHQAGDETLVDAAVALQRAVRAEDAVGRLGGDEFLVLAPVHDADGAMRMAHHLLEAVRQCMQGRRRRMLTASVGYALAPDDATQSMTLLRLADEAMYAAKRRGKNGVLHCKGLRQTARG